MGLVRVWRESGTGEGVEGKWDCMVRLWRESGTGEAVEGKWDW